MDLIYRCDPTAAEPPGAIGDAAGAIGELEAGNRRFRRVVDHVRAASRGAAGAALVLPLEPAALGVAMVDGVAMPQEPFGLVLGCSDARVPPETVLGQHCNDLFVVRVAGNVLGSEGLGSIDYAVANMKSIKLLLVLGHTGCGAVTAAVNMYLAPTSYPDLKLSHPLRTIVDRIMLAVRLAATALERAGGPRISEDAGYRAALLETSIYLNAALTAFDLVRRLDRDGHGHIEVVHGVFDLAALTVRSLPAGPDASTDAGPSFAAPPKRVDDFEAVASEIAGAVLRGGGIDRAFPPRR